MRKIILAVWAVVSIIGGTVGCVADVGESDYVPPQAPALAESHLGRFSSDLFQFKVVVADDGAGEGGGWQSAYTPIQFKGIKVSGGILVCTVRVEMPIRTKELGTIQPEVAAQTAAAVATDASKLVRARTRGRQWLGEDFCIEWRATMNDIFTDKAGPYYALGARAKHH